ncbi:hypothetical protein BFP72_11240 [Reichenbachiella sp. 5M10]|uniref:hypothetical protein n=1 Tax=Reichenbachiella sp. 5M10 TaxID=1889772 RepID=UPI000C15A409|nr:hypothetical protein [Reichenbachiella sp. 5M10]PIB35926.1 hypothetical protein BFP72_11240 [Reichenbachiella sp. 5M10]
MSESRRIYRTLVVILLGGLAACAQDIETKYSVGQVNHLLTAENSKEWERVYRSENGSTIDLVDCIDSNSLVFVEATKADSVVMWSQSFDCENSEQPTLVYQAYYELEEDAKGQFEGVIDLTNERLQDINQMEVLYLTSEYLRIEYSESGVKVVEEYSYE